MKIFHVNNGNLYARKVKNKMRKRLTINFRILTVFMEKKKHCFSQKHKNKINPLCEMCSSRSVFTAVRPKEMISNVTGGTVDGIQVWSLAQEGPPATEQLSSCTATTEPASGSYWDWAPGAHAVQREKPLRWDPAPQLGSGPTRRN